MPERPPPAALSLDRTARLLGPVTMETLARKHVLLFGVGGVGSYAAEGLARSGLGRLTLVDFDNICITNVNRQIHAFAGTVGAVKAEEMAARVRAINPALEVRAVKAFYSEESSDELLKENDADLVLDCIDSVAAKIHLLAACLQEGRPVITALGAAGKMDPTAVRCTSLEKSYNDRLGKLVRKNLRRIYRFRNADLRRITAVWSPEKAKPPVEDYESPICDQRERCPGEQNGTASCARDGLILGSLVTVTATFGMTAANAALLQLKA